MLCGACVTVAARAGDGIGLPIVGRGFDAAVAVPLEGTLIEALPAIARDGAAACPTGAFALKGEGGCCRLVPQANSGRQERAGSWMAGANSWA